MAGSTEFDAIVLDVMLPGIDGFETCRRLRDDGVWAPVLMLTARDAVEDRVAGLDHGADDYLVKPFSFAELLARLRALARRGPVERPVVLEAGDLRLDPATHQVWRARTRSRSAKEFALLEAFMRRPGEVLSRLQLLEHAWDYEYENRSNVIDVYVRYLREKIDRPFGHRQHRDRARRRLPAEGTTDAGPALDPGEADVAFAAALVARPRAGGAVRLPAVPSELTETIDDGLDARAADLAAVAADSEPKLRRTCSRARRASPRSSPRRRGGRLDAAPESAPRSIRRELEQAARVRADRPRGAGHRGRGAVLAEPATRGRRARRSWSGASTGDRDEALAGSRRVRDRGAAGAAARVGGSATCSRPARWPRSRRCAAGPGEITLERSGERLPLPAAEDEIHRLGETLNAMLDRIEASLERERVFVADASHELRTPLAILRPSSSWRGARASPEELRGARSAAEEVDRLSRLAEDLLVIARPTRAGCRSRASGRAARAARPGRDAFADRAARRRREIAVERRRACVPSSTRSDRAGARQPDRQRAAPRRREWRLGRAGDDGAGRARGHRPGGGFPPASRRVAFERFTRADDGRTGGGAGLGLAIVRAIAAAHGGCVAVDARRPRGSRPARAPAERRAPVASSSRPSSSSFVLGPSRRHRRPRSRPGRRPSTSTSTVEPSARLTSTSNAPALPSWCSISVTVPPPTASSAAAFARSASGR